MQYKNKCDILVIGGGMAGLYAANSAASQNPNLKVMLLTAGELGSGGCSKRTHGINAAMNDGDSSELHIKDTLEGGGNINNKKLVEALCTDIVTRIQELESWNLELDKTEDDQYDVGTYGGSSQSRSLHQQDLTGLKIIQILTGRAIVNGVFVKEHCWALQILHKNNNCYGVVALNSETKRLEIYYATAVILATGGGACVYPISSISADKLATGILMGYDAGLPLVDMEMVQFHPTGALLPNHPLNGSLLEEEMRTQGGKLLNRLGHRYMFDYDSRGESATRDIVARSTYMEIMAGRGTDNGGVILDISKFSKEKIRSRFPKTIKRLRTCDVDLLSQNKIEISPTAHFLMGGIIINENCETDMNGLFVCGEDAGGIHGGNRLGGNGVADALVFGYRAGANAAQYAENDPQFVSETDNIKIDFYNLDKSTIDIIDKKIKQLMWDHVGLVRDKNGLTTALFELNDIQTSLKKHLITLTIDEYNEHSSGLLEGKILAQKLQLATLITKSALARTNSVGAHFRSDSDKSSEKYNLVLIKNKHEEPDIAKICK